ncbi:MAG: peptide chain release factor 3, partial [Desulfobulbaceae bacterium]|nr:peptide chain release factor 3 [Desulfobulbaceae bacterium]
EYGVDAVYEGVNYATARWISCDDRKKLDEFKQKKQSNLALDGEGHLAFLAPSEWNLSRTMELFPDIVFHKTREYS